MFSFVLPASVYAEVRKDVASLSNVAQWQGYATSVSPPYQCLGPAQEAAASVLVRKFHDEMLRKIRSQRPQPIPQRPQPDATKDAPALNAVNETALPARPFSTSQDETTIKIETSLVVVPISVLDHDGRAVPNLTRQDFHIFEDNVAQEINHFSSMEIPFHVALLLDTSASMRLRDEDVRKAAGVFIQNLHPQDNVMVVSINSEVYLNAEFTTDRYQLGSAVNQTRNGAGTRLYDAVDLVLTERLKQINGRKAIVLFTDGVDTESRVSDARRSLELAEESGALIYTIHYDSAHDIAERPAFANIGGTVENLGTGRPNYLIVSPEAYRLATQYLRDLPERKGAREYQEKSISSLNEAFSSIVVELRPQYELSYYPTNRARDGSYRRIRVRLDRPDIVVHARPGYRAVQDVHERKKYTPDTEVKSKHP